MIRKVSPGDTGHQVNSVYRKFDLSRFRDVVSEMRNECEKYFDKQDLESALNGKKGVQVLAKEMNQHYSQVYAQMARINSPSQESDIENLV